MRRLSLGAAQAVLTALAVGSLVGFVVWVLGTNGFGVVLGGDLPRVLQGTGADAYPAERVIVDGDAALASTVAANDRLDFPTTGMSTPGSAEFYGGELRVAFIAPSLPQRVAWTSGRALPLLGAAAAWWLLARVVAAVRRGEGFAPRAVARLRAVGLLLALGAPLVTLARWGAGHWLLSTSEAADVASLPSPAIPWSPVAAGLTVLVLSVAWAENGRMRRDLEGLV